jgi:hypothetical protein
MTLRSPVQPPEIPAERRRLQQNDRSHQTDLFDSVTLTQTPAWRDLPEETRGDADRLAGAADPGTRSDQQRGLTDGGWS